MRHRAMIAELKRLDELEDPIYQARPLEKDQTPEEREFLATIAEAKKQIAKAFLISPADLVSTPQKPINFEP